MVEINNQNLRLSSSVPSISCISCYDTLKIDHLGIRCPQDHNICTQCTPNYLAEVFSNPSSNLPPKCCCCNEEIPARVFERQLNPIQLWTYTLAIIKQQIQPDECIMACPTCNYFEVWLNSSSGRFFHCKQAGCIKASCVYCKLQVILPKTQDLITLYRKIRKNDISINELINIYDSLREAEDKYEQELQSDKGISNHSKCADLDSCKIAIEEAVERGEKVPCPKCGLAGRKDDNCTHMTCPKCQTMWCYCCGLCEIDCDREIDEFGDAEGIYRHNKDWENNEKRCPMYFTAISEIDNRWPKEDAECMNRFHRYRTLKELETAIQTIGHDNYTLAFNHFDSVKNCGYTLQDLNDPLIKKPLIVRDHLNQVLDESDGISNQSREERSDRDSEDPDVVLRFDEDLLRILYQNTDLELIQQESLRRGQGARRRQHRGRGAGEHRERQDFPIEPEVQAGIGELIAMQEPAIRPVVEAVRGENRGRPRGRGRGRRGRRGRGDN